MTRHLLHGFGCLRAAFAGLPYYPELKSSAMAWTLETVNQKVQLCAHLHLCEKHGSEQARGLCGRYAPPTIGVEELGTLALYQ